MIRFTAIRLVEIAAIAVLMSFVIYALIGLMPGDPIDLMRQADPRISAPEDVPRSTLHSSEIPDESNGFAGQNATGFKNTEMDRLIDALEVELDSAKRKALWGEVQRLYVTELPSLPLYFRSDVFILPKWLKGLRPTGNQYPSTLWVTDWTAQP